MSSLVQHGQLITTETYYNGEVSEKRQELKLSLFTDKQSILKDVIDALSVVSSGASSKLTIEIYVDKQGRYRLVKKWLV